MDTERLRWPLAYLAGWLGAGLLVAGLTVAVLGHGGPPSPGVTVPPVREIALTSAARKAGCAVDARRAPSVAAAGAPRPGGRIYDEPVSAGLRERALRSGLIVIEYRADVTGRSLDTLKALQQAVPTGTILAPSRAGPRFALAAASFRRRLRCTRLSRATYDALLLFRGRYLGSAPRP